MKRFLLFMGSDYYPRGGWRDFQGGFDTLVDALKFSRANQDWYHVIDQNTGQMTSSLPEEG